MPSAPAEVAVVGLAVDADRVDQHFGLADQLLQRATSVRLLGVVAVGDDHERLLAVAPGLRERDGLGDRVVHRRAAARPKPAQRVAAVAAGRVVQPCTSSGRLLNR